MDTIDSEAEVSGKSWIRIMFIFSVMLILIGLILDDTMTSSTLWARQADNCLAY